jgi:integrase
VGLALTLAAHLSAQDRQKCRRRQNLGDAYAGFGIVIATPLDRDNVTKRLGRVLKAAGIPAERPFHTLRHDNATLSLLAGVNAKTTADRLGHHSPAFTLERYTHAVRELDDDAADRLQAVLREARRKATEAG